MTTVTDFVPFFGSVGGGFVAGALVGYAVRQVIKIAAVVVGLFIAALAYLQYQGIIHVDWPKFQAVSQNGITWVADGLTHISNNIGAPNSATSDLGLSNIIPLTSSVSAGFMLGILRG
jgi:uncharacterized membrane protein (Fun14 family)